MLIHFSIFWISFSIISGQFVCNETVRSPQQIRLAYRMNGMTVSWTTAGLTNGTNDSPNPTVLYGLSPTSLTSQSIGSSTTYGTFWFHNVALINLQSSTTYYYMILNTPSVASSAIYSFRSAPDFSSSNEPCVFTILGDLGLNRAPSIPLTTPIADSSTCYCASQTIDSLIEIEEETDWFLHLGDIAYADYSYLISNASYEDILNDWQCQMQSITAEKAYMTLPGNHDVTCREPLISNFCPNTEQNFSAYLHRWYMAGDEAGGFQNMWYSFDYGQTHFIIIDTETDFPNAPSGPGTSLDAGNFIGSTQQLAWFEQDLVKANANRAQVPWIIVAGHRSFHSSQSSKACAPCLLAFERFLYQYNVDIYFAGHSHWYERFYPIEMNTTEIVSFNYTNITQPIYITNGAAGNPSCGEPNITQPLNFSAKIVYQCGYGQLIVYNSTHARWNFYLSQNHILEDQIDIIKQRYVTVNQGKSYRISHTMTLDILIIMFIIYMDI